MVYKSATPGPSEYFYAGPRRLTQLKQRQIGNFKIHPLQQKIFDEVIKAEKEGRKLQVFMPRRHGRATVEKMLRRHHDQDS